MSTLRVFFRRRRQFSELLASNSNLTFNRYFRLMALAGVELCSTVPLTIYLIVFSLRNPIYQWAGLADLHWGFSRVSLFPAVQWLMTPGQMTGICLQPWLTIACAIIFFLFFGLAEEARTHYRLAFTTVAKKLGYSTAGTLTSSTGFGPYVFTPISPSNCLSDLFPDRRGLPSSVSPSPASSNAATTDAVPCPPSLTSFRSGTSTRSTMLRRRPTHRHSAPPARALASLPPSMLSLFIRSLRRRSRTLLALTQELLSMSRSSPTATQ